MTLQNSDHLKHKAFSNPMRIRMLEYLGTPRTVKQIAGEMGMRPHTLYHHIKVLQECGIVELVGSEKLKGSIEKKYYQLAKEYLSQANPDITASKEIICFARAVSAEQRDAMPSADQPAIESNSLVTIRSEDASRIKEKLDEGLKQLVEKYLKPFETPDGDTVFILKTFIFLK